MCFALEILFWQEHRLTKIKVCNCKIPYPQHGKVPQKKVRCKPQGSFARFGYIPHLENLGPTNAELQSKLRLYRKEWKNWIWGEHLFWKMNSISVYET